MIAMWGVLLASLLGSVHCAGMCSGFVCFYSQASPGARASGGWAHVAYNAGRLTSYLALGATAGLLGAGLDTAGAAAGVARLAAIVAGTLMVGWGGATILAARGVHVPLPSAGSSAARYFASSLMRLRGQSRAVRAGVTGLLTTLLPCGWLYAFVATAGGTGSVPRALLVMFVFWAGTLPMMLSVGYGAQRVLGPMRQRLPTLTAATVMILGLLSITGHLRPLGADHAPSGTHAAHGAR